MKRSALVLVGLLALLNACSRESSKSSAAKPAPWNMSLQTSPQAPRMSRDVTFRLTIANQQGQPVNQAQVNGSLVMTLMDMGKNEFRFVEKAPGVYEGTGKMDMAGPWELEVTARASGVQGQKKFPVNVRE